MTEETQPEVTFEQALGMYEQRLQEQTAIIFSLVAKMGGEVTLTPEDLIASPEFNTVAADDAEGGGITLKLSHEER
jgi:hypothetical protein